MPRIHRLTLPNITAPTIAGRGLARTIGYPTINLMLPAGHTWPAGAYLVDVSWNDSTPTEGMLRIPPNPCDAHKPPIGELHVLDTNVAERPAMVTIHARTQIDGARHWAHPQDALSALAADVAAAANISRKAGRTQITHTTDSAPTTRECNQCIFFLSIQEGYSNYTVEDTTDICMAGLPFTPHEGHACPCLVQPTPTASGFTMDPDGEDMAYIDQPIMQAILDGYRPSNAELLRTHAATQPIMLDQYTHGHMDIHPDWRNAMIKNIIIWDDAIMALRRQDPDNAYTSLHQVVEHRHTVYATIHRYIDTIPAYTGIRQQVTTRNNRLLGTFMDTTSAQAWMATHPCHGELRIIPMQDPRYRRRGKTT